MKSWTEEIDIDAPIEEVWTLFDGSLANMQKIMPQVVDNQPIHETPDVVGSIYRQKFKEGKRIMEYDVKTLQYENQDTSKTFKVGFTLADMFDITAMYELEKLDEEHTRFRYTATNQPLKWYVKLILMFARDKVVVDFVKRVKRVAESETKEE
ncbi:SRPBCC family protein [Hazenella sp. IB182357]|uniref:SRPBCC family protein n=1 Tax=Polycladospora coralii TaxID=2771432 RepID=A0A926NBL2_9BACL|nr:SRPBCC family protein [Polycladospora coralii]MBD1372775.1 SRPBCC family protein [Polycladospora coralii]MBS7529527.1 SRPBCC family protein [Polycladospora coralii]